MLPSAAVAAATLLSFTAPAAPAGSPERPPTDAVKIDGLEQGCQPEHPCDLRPITITPDKTYPSRLAAWAKDALP